MRGYIAKCAFFTFVFGFPPDLAMGVRTASTTTASFNCFMASLLCNESYIVYLTLMASLLNGALNMRPFFKYDKSVV